jgi:hypothetical protein
LGPDQTGCHERASLGAHVMRADRVLVVVEVGEGCAAGDGPDPARMVAGERPRSRPGSRRRPSWQLPAKSGSCWSRASLSTTAGFRPACATDTLSERSLSSFGSTSRQYAGRCATCWGQEIMIARGNRAELGLDGVVARRTRAVDFRTTAVYYTRTPGEALACLWGQAEDTQAEAAAERCRNQSSSHPRRRRHRLTTSS